MKLVYVGPYPIPSPYANSVQVMQMCAAFAANGHDVVLIVPRMEEGVIPCSDSICARYGLPPSFAIEQIRSSCRHGAPHLYALRAAARARRLQGEVVYSRQVTACAAAAARGIRTIYEAHQPVVGRVARSAFCYLRRSSFFSHAVVISGGLRDHFAGTYCLSGDRLLVAHDGANVGECLMFETNAETEQPPSVGYTGHLYPGKGMETIAALAARMPDVQFEVIGGTPGDIARWQEITEGCDNLLFHGHMDHRALPAHLARFQVVLAPYQRSVVVSGGQDIAAWMSPLKLFEYMAAGRAIVCSDLPVLREVLLHGEDALLVDPEDIEGWEQAVRTLLNQPLMRKRLGTAARKKLEQRYTWAARAKRVLAPLSA